MRWGIYSAALLCFCAGCHEEPLRETPSPYFPLAVGNKWSYEVIGDTICDSVSIEVTDYDSPWYTVRRRSYFGGSESGVDDHRLCCIDDTLFRGDGSKRQAVLSYCNKHVFTTEAPMLLVDEGRIGRFFACRETLALPAGTFEGYCELRAEGDWWFLMFYLGSWYSYERYGLDVGLLEAASASHLVGEGWYGERWLLRSWSLAE